MTRNLGVGTILAVAALSAGCIDQRYLITSDPPGAMVLHNGAPIGATPVDDQFVYYGKHHFTLVKDGYETLQIDQDIPAPWYEYPPLDFVTEVLYPGRLHDVHAFHYQMRPAEPPNKEDVLERGKQLRSRGQALVGQEPPPPPTAEAPPPPPPLGPPMPAAPDGR
jgi:PEGA domain-containing protein